MKMSIPGWAQVALHLGFTIFYNGQAAGLIHDGPLGQWLTICVSGAQMVLLHYGIFRYPPPPRRAKKSE